jgi:uncharacterized membrane protein
VGAALIWVAGLTPSLLPRPPLIAVGLAGLLAALGYGVGSAIGGILRRVLPEPGWWRPVLWSLAAAGWALALVACWPATAWQDEQSEALGMAPASPPPLALAVGGLALAALLVLLGRGLRALGRGTSRRLARRLSIGWSRVLGVLAPVLLVVIVLAVGYAGTLLAFTRIDSAGSGAAAPTSPLRSGGPGSPVSYASLGAEGQSFVTGGPSVAAISDYTGEPALEPIRVFVGLRSAPTPEARAALAVEELRRTGAFDRRVLVVAATTGNGFLDPALVSAPEVLLGGDVATVAAQYSVLPSWLSFLVDQRAAGEESIALWNAVREAVAALPVERRPMLATSGESLGAFGGQAPFAGRSPDEVAQDVAAAVWVGSPNSSAVWSAWRDDRTSGPVWEPAIGDGAVARAPATADSEAWAAPGWGERRLVLTQHPNDPVAWWAVPLLWERPSWLDQPRGPGVDARVTWWPVVLFLQTGLDLAAAGAVPAGVGHNYGDVTVRAWAAALSVPGSGPGGSWTADDSARLADATAR